MIKNNHPKVSIIFSNLNGGEEPLECLSSIQKLTYPKAKIETIVVDNGSADGSPDKIEKKFPNVKLVRLKKAIGLPASLNLGIKKSIGSFIFIANDDIVLEKNSISRMVSYFKNHKDTGVLGGKVFHKLPRAESPRDCPKSLHKRAEHSEVCIRFGVRPRTESPRYSASEYKNQPTKLTDSASSFNFYLGSIKKPHSQSEILWLQSCAIMIPKTVFDKIGLFDEGFYPLYFDDFDFCLRARKANFKLVLLKEAVFWHGCGKTTEKSQKIKIYYWWYRNKIRFMLKNATVPQILSSLAIQIFVSSARSIMERQNLLLPLFKASLENFREISKTIKARKLKVPK